MVWDTALAYAIAKEVGGKMTENTKLTRGDWVGIFLFCGPIVVGIVLAVCAF
jgi:hypothetical protein